jgi:uncharacterized protein YsxB (DUF464 family)
MIKVRILRMNQRIVGFIVKGHANYDEYGKDIVCAGVSAISVGGLNALASLKDKNIELKMSDGHILIRNASSNEEAQIILNTIIIQLQTVKEIQKDYIKIIEQ